MKKIIKRLLCVVLAVILVSLGVLSPYIISFVVTEDAFEIEKTQTSFFENNTTTSLSSQSDVLNSDGSIDLSAPAMVILNNSKFSMFNYYGINYSADAYVKGTLHYKKGLKEVSEDFFLEPSKEPVDFYSFIDGCLENEKGYKVTSIAFESIDKKKCNLKVYGFSVFNREVPEQEIYIEAQSLKLGIDLLWGGALSYLEDMDSNVQAVMVDGKTKVDSNAEKRYNSESVNDNVNLINANDTGRLVQQSYYGTLEYDFGVFMENDWRYNPVQGGNQYNEASKIVDLKITDNSIYIKCRPLDWAKEKEFITPSYMEATYTIEDGKVHTTCRFVDFSGYPEAESSQEIPAFYCIEPFNNFVYYKGNKPWTNDKLTNEPDLIFWPDAGYPKFYSKENWAAFTGEFEDSFGIGIFVPGEEEFLAGVYNRETTDSENPAKADPTSYIAITKTRTFRSFDPYEYEYYLATGDAEEIRASFGEIKK